MRETLELSLEEFFRKLQEVSNFEFRIRLVRKKVTRDLVFDPPEWLSKDLLEEINNLGFSAEFKDGTLNIKKLKKKKGNDQESERRPLSPSSSGGSSPRCP